MQKIKSKIKQMKPLITIRKAKLDQETILLNSIRKEKADALELLQKNQTSYMQGVERLNKERTRGNLVTLPTLGRGLDRVKDLWYQSLTTVRSIEERERQQLVQVVDARKNLKSMETLEETYQTQLSAELKRAARKETDEMAIHMHREKNAKRS